MAGDITRLEIAPDKATLLDMRNKLQNLKKKIISVMADCDYYLSQYPTKKRLLKKDINEAEKTIIEEYELKYFFETINRIIEHIYIATKFKHPGAPVKKRNLISSAWAHLISDSGYKFEWDVIAELLDWFWEKLRSYDIYNELNPEGKESNQESIRIQFFRSKGRILNFYKEIKKRDGQKNWLDIQTIVFLGEGIYTLLDFSFLSELNHYFNSKRRESIPYIKDAFNYAAKLYKENPTSPPKIIFPDLTYI